MPTLPTYVLPPSDPAPWVTGASLASDKRLDDANMPSAVTFDDCAMAATVILYKRSGRRYRILSTVLRPHHGSSCDCWSPTTEIDLPGPVIEDTLVITIDGVVLDASAYRLYDKHLLVRRDGSTWPTCSHLSWGTGTDWSIAFDYGQLPDMGGILACRELAIHIALGASGKISKIPARATTLTTRGLSVNLLRGQRFGIPIVDDWLDAVNPNRLQGRPSVMSPDTIQLSAEGEATPPDYFEGF